MKAIEKAVQDKKDSEEVDEKIKSPYTKVQNKHKTVKYMLVYIIIGLIVLLAIYWSIKQITVGSDIATIAGIN